MKILINGYTLSERMEIKKQYYSREDISNLDKAIGHLKRNRKKYMMVVTAIAITIDLSGITLGNTLVASLNPVMALQTSLGKQFGTIIELLKFLVKYTCLGMGLKEMIITILNGGNMKEASMAGIQYWLGYLFIQFYPTLFEM